MNADRRRSSTIAALFVLPLVLVACDAVAGARAGARRTYDNIFTDFKQQPRIEPWEAEYRGDSVGFPGNPQMSVPITGAIAPGYLVSYAPTPAALDSLSGLANPVPMTSESLERGRRYYQVNCAVCHGAGGAGDGTVVRYGLPVPPLTNIGQYSDGYLFGIIRNGRGLMPNYRRIPEEHRWDVVNYMRGLQGVAGVTVSREPAGIPGEGGAAVPGASVTAPTRPVPHFQAPRTQRETDPASPPPTGVAPQGEQP